ncbi:hypothetical protein [Sphingomonas astaxanthinifaciens]|uniref:Uncharacterized protein n=1 Tax=Sphingomonas astaxanthinifaciens DSM 22298 TaxID=1123267 RepID=A0ABQ5Z5F0_9SPHN|nr:hypothetical protein [Sphingomonas astaxanthinifaciens]GLR46865.1 hypothetical protein GCM10007925_05760 [Sphingomonas astaxanthinifaciens DSM 22298]
MSATRPDAAPRRADRFTRPQTLLILLAFALLVALRLPNAWVHGRFQDEEATVFLAYAWHFPWEEALFRPFGGYLNIGANAPGVLLAHLVKSGVIKLEYAPYLTMTLALVVQLAPGLLLLTGKADWLPSRTARCLALLVVVLAPSTEEVYLNTLHIQFHLALCAAIILALDIPRRRAVRILYLVPLLLGPLCGPGAILLVPLFALRAYVDRDPQRAFQLTALGLGALIQMLVFYYPSPIRGHWLDPLSVGAAMFIRLFMLPLVGLDISELLGALLGLSRETTLLFVSMAALASAVIFGGLLLRSLRRRETAFWLLFAGLFIAAVTLTYGMTSSIDPKAPFRPYTGERYNFLPVVLLGLALIGIIPRAGPRLAIWLKAFLFLYLAVGAMYYPSPMDWLADGPSWPAEVAKWRADPNYQLTVWPKMRRADLSGIPKPCTPPSSAAGDPRAPRYCESGWLVGKTF